MKNLLKGEIKTQLNKRIVLLLSLIIAFTTIVSFRNYNNLFSGMIEYQLFAEADRLEGAEKTFMLLDDIFEDVNTQKTELEEEGEHPELVKEYEEKLKNMEIEKDNLLHIVTESMSIVEVLSTAASYAQTPEKYTVSDIENQFSKVLELGAARNEKIYQEIYLDDIPLTNTRNIYGGSRADFKENYEVIKERVRIGESIDFKPTGLSKIVTQRGGVEISTIVLILFLNFNIWSKEFEGGHIKTLLTQPVSRRNIYLCRTIVGVLKTIVVAGLIYLLPVIISAILNGWGDMKVAGINTLALDNIFTFKYTGEIYEYITATTVTEYMSYYLSIYFIYILFSYSLFSFISIAAKNDFSSLMISFITLFLIFVGHPFNPLAYSGIDNLLMGELNIGAIGAMTILVVCTIVLQILSYTILKKYEGE